MEARQWQLGAGLVFFFWKKPKYPEETHTATATHSGRTQPGLTTKAPPSFSCSTCNRKSYRNVCKCNNKQHVDTIKGCGSKKLAVWKSEIKTLEKRDDGT